MSARISPSTLRHSRDLRSGQTEAEARLWQAVRARRLMGLRFKRQVPIEPYIVDFLCPEHRLVIELDGSQHQDAVAYDERRTWHLQERGYRVVRFTNDDVLSDLDGTCSHIVALCRREQPPLPGTRIKRDGTASRDAASQDGA